jgi:hypothetical protein
MKFTVTSSTLVNVPDSNNEMTSSMVISSKLGGAGCERLKVFWAAPASKVLPLTTQTEQQASGSHLVSIIKVVGIALFNSRWKTCGYVEGEDA